MGACQHLCRQQLVIQQEVTIQQKRQKKKQSDKDSKTNPNCSQKGVVEENIGEEFRSPQEIQYFHKRIKNLNIAGDRKNRFMHDIEEEIKYIIRKNIEEERENLKRVQQIYEQELELQRKEQLKKQKEQLDNQFSFQNSIIQSSDNPSEHPSANPFQPKSTSQFAPRRNDNDTVSQKSQISKTPTPPYKDKSISSQSDAMRKSALIKIIQAREELASNNASKGSSKKKLMLDAYEKMFSEFFSQDERGSSSQSKSHKSILKNRSLTHRSFSGSKSIKSTHTAVKKSKRVRFSKETNFSYERKSTEKKKKSFWDW
ncbi:unnamed protein product (macronuclear) [Paramecium tetraurelia]|uniref:Uncharacterized protein n=1 Tax=Paramecium tetraurelia TaxID=5888 RepID=A0BI48_PARTE|nr:uncharacterized protein GSPATT00029251001 [Paramecium tetraurelia]CAK58215.1 unnamed protein product [Paramecium tetraurelia]|eukprot:XP_001425613.1 hypothetical protein (macronuclear) [Paramecium tetraurelia strain d4-2]